MYIYKANVDGNVRVVKMVNLFCRKTNQNIQNVSVIVA